MNEERQAARQEQEQEQKAGSGQLKDLQVSALAAAGTVIVFSAVYWFLQIQSVLELLELAYG